jgi:hypothetical protein
MADKITTFMCPKLLKPYGPDKACNGLALSLISLMLVFYADVQYAISAVGEFVTIDEVDQTSWLYKLYL